MNGRQVYLGGMGFLVILLFIGGIDFSQKIPRLLHMRQQSHAIMRDINLGRQLLTIKHNIEPDVQGEKINDTTSLLFKIFSIAEAAGCTLKFIDPHEPKLMLGNWVATIELALTGQLAQLQAFYYAVEQQRLPLFFTRINLHHEVHEQWRLFVNLSALVENHGTNHCLSLRVQSDQNMLLSFPVNQMRYAGQMANHRIQWALVKLPNAKTLALQKGSIIGIEKLLVVAINPNNQKIMLASGREIIR